MIINGTKDGAPITYTYIVDPKLKSLTSYREDYYFNKLLDNVTSLSLYFEDINTTDVINRGTNILSYAEILASSKNLPNLSLEILIKGEVTNTTNIKEIFGCENTAKITTYTPYGSNISYTLYILLYEF